MKKTIEPRISSYDNIITALQKLHAEAITSAAKAEGLAARLLGTASPRPDLLPTEGESFLPTVQALIDNTRTVLKNIQSNIAKIDRG